ncbi:Homeobox-leucine zipper protein like [Melia azedarach]|uniref:Homeobox-leucine zipper protein like n=1 Tax=Melia azedarach TaxID=155640 RepID=A0ACC1YTK7_MELAZ|nr:Homeobox-leucine zipper protein like [Melia azedarach]
MDIFHSQQNQKHPQKFHSKKRLTQDQVRLLERSFTSNKKLDTELKQKLANQLSVPPRQVAIWYQNKRARWKTQSLELDYNTIQVKLENALAEKRRLEKDVKQLREELRQAQQVLFALSNQKALETNNSTTVVSCNNYSTATSCSDQKGHCSSFSSLLHEDYVHGGDHDHHDGQALQIDHELYACLIGAGGSAWG